MNTIETTNYIIKIEPDYDPLCPRTDFDNLGTMVCWHRRYSLGDHNPFSDPDDFKSWWKKECKGGGLNFLFIFMIMVGLQ